MTLSLLAARAQANCARQNTNFSAGSAWRFNPKRPSTDPNNHNHIQIILTLNTRDTNLTHKLSIKKQNLA